jgi:hypothetical protein
MLPKEPQGPRAKIHSRYQHQELDKHFYMDRNPNYEAQVALVAGLNQKEQNMLLGFIRLQLELQPREQRLLEQQGLTETTCLTSTWKHPSGHRLTDEPPPPSPWEFLSTREYSFSLPFQAWGVGQVLHLGGHPGFCCQPWSKAPVPPNLDRHCVIPGLPETLGLPPQHLGAKMEVALKMRMNQAQDVSESIRGLCLKHPKGPVGKDPGESTCGVLFALSPQLDGLEHLLSSLSQHC